MFNIKNVRKSSLISFGAILVAAIMGAISEYGKQKEQKEFDDLKTEHEDLKNRVEALENSEN